MNPSRRKKKWSSNPKLIRNAEHFTKASTGNALHTKHIRCAKSTDIVHDRVFKRATEHYPEIEAVTADAGYKTPWICKQVIDNGRIPSLPYKRPMMKKGNLSWYEYVYDGYYDCILCPQNHVLSCPTTNREGYREYKSKSYICKNRPVREQCAQKSTMCENSSPTRLA